jgi:protein-S-isoprenylcysteine O-methyltransferase Ste14
MLEGLIHIAIGAFFVLAVGGLALARVRRDTASPQSRTHHLSRPTQALMLLAFGGFAITFTSAALTQAWPLQAPPDDWPTLALPAIGLTLIAIGAAIVVSVFIGSRKHTWAVDTDALATTGIYGRTRNPRALGWFLIYAGLALTARSTAALLLAPIYLLGYLPWILLEEVALERHFGDLYRAYRHRTPRFI